VPLDLLKHKVQYNPVGENCRLHVKLSSRTHLFFDRELPAPIPSGMVPSSFGAVRLYIYSEDVPTDCAVRYLLLN